MNRNTISIPSVDSTMMLSSTTRPMTPPPQPQQHCYYWNSPTLYSPSGRTSPTTIIGHHHYNKRHRRSPPPLNSIPLPPCFERNTISDYLEECTASLVGQSVRQNHSKKISKKVVPMETRDADVTLSLPKLKIPPSQQGQGPREAERKRKAPRNEDQMEEDESNLALLVEEPLIPEKQEVGSLLFKTFAHIKKQLHSGSKQRDYDFNWAHQELCSLRQDIIKTHPGCSFVQKPFCLEVYEYHARLLLGHSKLEDFDQCLTEMRSLGLDKHQSESAADEFAGYAILSALVCESWIELHQVALHHQEQQKLRSRSATASSSSSSSCYQHALAVVRAVQSVDYQTFFRLHETAPSISQSIMKNHLLDRVRQAAYLRIIYAHRPNNIGIEQVRVWLHLDTLESTRLFLQEQGAVFLGEPKSSSGSMPDFWIDCKASQRRCAVNSKKLSLPQEDDSNDESPPAATQSSE